MMRRTKKKLAYMAVGLLIAGTASAVSVATYLHGYNADTGGGVYDVTGLDLADDVNVLVVGAYVDNNGVYPDASFGGVAPDAIIDTTSGVNRMGVFYWLNPNTSAGQTLSVTCSITGNNMAWQLLGLSGVDTAGPIDTTGSPALSAGSTTLETTSNNMFIVSMYSVNAGSVLTPTAPLDKTTYGFVDQGHNGGGTITPAAETVLTAGTNTLAWSSTGGTANQALAGLAFYGGADIPLTVSLNPVNESVKISTNDFPLTIGGELVNGTSDIVWPGGIQLLLNGTNVLVGGDVVDNSPTTTVSHVESSLEDGTYDVDLVYSTYANTNSFTTNSWTFTVASPGTPGNIVYVDSDTTNTLAWDGFDYTAAVPWTPRPGYGNNDTAWQAEGGQARLATTITGLPVNVYKVYAYFWASNGGDWRLAAALEDNPSGDLPLYVQSSYPANTDLFVPYVSDPRNYAWGSWADPVPNPYFSTNLLTNPYGTNSVKVAQGQQRLVQVYLGTVSGSSITVYVDDNPAVAGFVERSWYDGIGYEVSGDAVVLQSKTPDGIIVSNSSVSVGAELIDANETLDTGSVELHVDGSDVITGGDVVKTATTTTVSHVVSGLSGGTHTVDLIYSTTEQPSVSYTNSWSFEVQLHPIVYLDATAGNTIMAASTNGPVGAGTALVTSPDSLKDGLWRFRTGLGVAPSVTNGPTGTIVLGATNTLFESHDYQTADNVPRLKTSVSGLEDRTYAVYAYFWNASAQWCIRAGLEDTPGTNSLAYYDATTSNVLHVATDDSGTRTLHRAFLGYVTGTSIDVYVEDLPGVDSNDRVWYDGIGYQRYDTAISPDLQSISITGGTAMLTWMSETAGTYSIKHKTSLTDPTWTVVTNGIAGGDPTTSASVPVSGTDSEFFQIQGN